MRIKLLLKFDLPQSMVKMCLTKLGENCPMHLPAAWRSGDGTGIGSSTGVTEDRFELVSLILGPIPIH